MSSNGAWNALFDEYNEGIKVKKTKHTVFIGENGSGHDTVVKMLCSEQTSGIDTKSTFEVNTVSPSVSLSRPPDETDVLYWAVTLGSSRCDGRTVTDILHDTPDAVYAVVDVSRPWTIDHALILIKEAISQIRATNEGDSDAEAEAENAEGNDDEVYLVAHNADRIFALHAPQFAVPQAYEQLLAQLKADSYTDILDLILWKLRKFCADNDCGLVSTQSADVSNLASIINSEAPTAEFTALDRLVVRPPCPPVEAGGAGAALGDVPVPVPDCLQAVTEKGSLSTMKDEAAFVKVVAGIVAEIGPKATPKPAEVKTTAEPAARPMKANKKNLQAFWTTLSEAAKK